MDSDEVNHNGDLNEDESVFQKRPAHLSSREEQELAKVKKATTHSPSHLLDTHHLHKIASFKNPTLVKYDLDDSPLEDMKRAQKIVDQSQTPVTAEEKLYEHGLSSFPTCEPKCLGMKRTQLDTDDLSIHPPKISKASSNNWASAKYTLFKVNEPSSSLIPKTCSITVPTLISTKSLSAQDAQIVSLLGSPKMPGQSDSSDKQTHDIGKSSISVFQKSCRDSEKDIGDVKPLTMILSGAQKCVSPALVASKEGSDIVQISKTIGDKMTQIAYLALEEERKMQTSLAAEVSRMKEVNENLFSRIDSRISENLELEKLLKQERERSILELNTQKEKHKAEIIKCKTELVKSHVTNGRLQKKCDALKTELDELVKRENLKQERERVLSLEKELDGQKEKYRVDITEYQSRLEKSKKRAAELLQRTTYLESDIPNREAAAVLAFKTSSEYHETIKAVFIKAYEDCRAMLKEYCPQSDFMLLLDEKDSDESSAEKGAQGKEVAIRTEDGSTDGATTA